ncbi:hypothetical protein TNCV_3160521 [Trichonephila clavipes]|nr:hypothetical protein TNCV_3160521 [Trichonephila clavipes]
MATPGSSFTPTFLGQEDNLGKDLVGMYPLCMIFGSGGLGGGTTSRKLWSNHARLTTDREDSSILHIAGEHRITLTTEISVLSTPECHSEL